LIELIPLGELLQSKAVLLICYPDFNQDEAERRMEELRMLGVEGIELRGKHMLRGIPILGKGNVGLVIAARVGTYSVALKVRRTDADRSSMRAEADNLRFANTINVGPKLLASSENFIVMELVEGEYLWEWLENTQRSQAETLRMVLRSLLEDGRRLDTIGLDHGELSKAHGHLILTNKGPKIIDFETASVNRRASNVTSLVNYFFFTLGKMIERCMRLPDREKLIEALRIYKSEANEESYRNLLDVCGLTF